MMIKSAIQFSYFVVWRNFQIAQNCRLNQMLLTRAQCINLTDTNVIGVLCNTEIIGPVERNDIYDYHPR
jgi:hypothetical protein